MLRLLKGGEGLLDNMLLLKGIKVAVVSVILVALYWISRKEREIWLHRGWPMLLLGLLLVLAGDIINLGSEFPGFNPLLLPLEPVHLDSIRMGLWIVGNGLLAVGFWHWLPLVSEIRFAQQDLERANQLLERQILERTLELRTTNEQLQRDIEERRKVEESFRYLAHHDALTSLPNRALFRDRLDHAIAQANRYGYKVAVMFLDLDRFKAINDTLGHNAGDELLKIVGDRLRNCVRDCDIVARLGGDEFTIIVEDIVEDADAAVVANKILDAVAQPFNLLGHEVFITTSVGITLFPNDDHDADNLLRNADAAMYQAKESGRSNYQFYLPDMNIRARERLKMESSLRRAMERSEFTLHYQPRVDMESGQIMGAEALLRWRHAEMGTVSPSEFVPILEDTGLIIPVGEWALRTACAQNRQWQEMGLPPIRVAVNLSVRQFFQRDLAELVSQVLTETGMEAQYLELEITEDSLLDSNHMNTTTLTRLKELGVHISIDDFGTGYSSLSYLRRLPIDTLKIDQSFVRDITSGSDGAAIASAIIAMASSLRLKVLAEGVETDEQLSFLRSQGCDEIQGFSFSHPVSAEEFGQLLREGRQMQVLQGLGGYYVNMVSNARVVN